MKDANMGYLRATHGQFMEIERG